MNEPLVVEDQMLGPWGTIGRIAQTFLGCLCDTLACSPWGIPTLDPACGENMGEVCKIVMPGPMLEVHCCGAVAVAVRRLFWHDGSLNEVRTTNQVDACANARGLHWGAEISAAVLRCVPDLGTWGGMPIMGGERPVGSVDPDILTDYATVLSADQMAMMLAQEMCFTCPEGIEHTSIERNKKINPTWVPAAVDRINFGPNCKGNMIGFGQGQPIRINLANDMLPCGEDCVSLAGYYE